ncbi:hypothetical protein NHX12_026445 [Muraenolepis orangiensis]|uniref:Prospero domain-containing protein n=1 Tax=Muraenolepis orangiensis TaxID=630683 RepID=A0A9Q0EHE5_9TELE|nr:hypothetical protein NHX12_026445 [Muraenolepis orangiensis]
MHASSNAYLECQSPEHLQLKHISCAPCTTTDGPDLLSGPPPLWSLTAIPCRPTDWPQRNICQAKRARVENITRDMARSSSSSSHEPDIDGATEDVQEHTVGPREWTQTKRGGAGYGNSEDQTIRNPLQNFECRPVRKLRSSGGLPHENWARDSVKAKEETPLEEIYSLGRDSTSIDQTNTFTHPNCTDAFEIPSGRKACGRKKVRLTNGPKQKPDIVNTLMADILKYQLSRAVSLSVDSIFKSMPLLEPPVVVMETGVPHQSPLGNSHRGITPRRSPYEDDVSSAPLPDVQTQALSLVVQKPLHARFQSFVRPPQQHHPKPEFSYSQHTELCSEDQASECLKGGVIHQLRCFKTQKGASAVLKQEHAAGSKVRCKVNSRSVRGTQTARHFAVDPVCLESLPVPLGVKAKPQSMMMSNLFQPFDGLTTCHLKKAKLMFFYTRYPSSLVLRSFFYDVQFTRCITSQLIKWFSNFREFYYIQMEKQARQAVSEGAPHAWALTVGRESELFRALNMHFNKASDFQVPDRFLEVAAITLREFWAAVSLGRDSEPSWKKPIYKVISKLDSNVPEEFKTHNPD